MVFYADLHVHSKHSRATSRDGDLEHMAFWARKKGIAVVATGDFTHPAWMEEIREKLVPAEPGLLRLRDDLERRVDEWLGPVPGEPTRFLLEVEISTIYKRDDRTRKVHHLLYAPDVDAAASISASLARIGNLASDGRPILGLDSRDLLEITLEASEDCFLIPAHIWTPWFAVLGSKSGFDSIEHCYGDLADRIFAVETGLSSDPAMNRRLTALDRYTLVSNSDAHSPPRLGREACVFETELDYFSMRRALETREGYGGTVELFPEEGKYHLDGHRKCGVRLEPEESLRHDGACPKCGKKLTLGVLHRVSELADRSPDDPTGDPTPWRSLVPLEEVLSEIQGVGPKSKAVQTRYEKLLARLGPELHILERAPLDEVDRRSSPVLAEALRRLRGGEVLREAGYDGEYGRIHLFEKGELDTTRRGQLLLDLGPEPPEEIPGPDAQATAPPTPGPTGSHPAPAGDRGTESPGTIAGPSKVAGPSRSSAPRPSGPLAGLDPDQLRAATTLDGPLLIVAGPGTGKTRTLTRRIAHVVESRDVSPSECLAITFTRRAAEELSERLRDLLPPGRAPGRPRGDDGAARGRCGP